MILVPPITCVTSSLTTPVKSACVRSISVPPRKVVISPPLKFFETIFLWTPPKMEVVSTQSSEDQVGPEEPKVWLEPEVPKDWLGLEVPVAWLAPEVLAGSVGLLGLGLLGLFWLLGLFGLFVAGLSQPQR